MHRGLSEAMRSGERADLASEATRNAERRAEHDRIMDLRAVEEAISDGKSEADKNFVGFFVPGFIDDLNPASSGGVEFGYKASSGLLFN